MVRIDVAEFNTLVADGSYSGGRSISNATGLLALSLLVSINVEQVFFNDDGSDLTPVQVDDLTAITAQAIYEIIKSEEFSMLPIGFVMPYAGLPGALTDDFLLCDGTTYLRVDFPGLWEVLETAFIVDADHFIVPDMDFKFPLGGEASIGQTGGEENHLLDQFEIPSHAHGIATGIAPLIITGSPGAPPQQAGRINGDVNGAYLTSIDTTNLFGGGGAHNNMPPFMRLRYYIKAR